MLAEFLIFEKLFNMIMQYKRILLKLSGEALMGDGEYGIDSKVLSSYANEIHANCTRRDRACNCYWRRKYLQRNTVRRSWF